MPVEREVSGGERSGGVVAPNRQTKFRGTWGAEEMSWVTKGGGWRVIGRFVFFK